MKKSRPLMGPLEQDKEDNRQFIFAEFMSVGIAFGILAVLAAVCWMCIIW